MALKRRKILRQMLNLGFGTDTVPADSGGNLVGDKIGIHTLLGDNYVSLATFASEPSIELQFAAAHTALPAAGGIIDARNLSGTHNLATTLSFSKPVTLLLGSSCMSSLANPIISTSAELFIEGYGPGISYIEQASTTNTAIQIASEKGCTIQNLTIRSKNDALQASGAAISLTGPGGSVANSRGLIRNVDFRFQKVGIQTDIVDTLEISKCTFTAIQQSGIRIANSVNGDQGIIGIKGCAFFCDTTDPTALATAEGITLISGDSINVGGCYFSTLNIGFHMNWGSNSAAGQLVIRGNVFEAQNSGHIRFDRQIGYTGSFGGVIVDGNWHRSDATYTGDMIRVSTNSAWLAFLQIVNNLMYIGATTTTGINFAGGGAGDNSYIAGNNIYGGAAGTGITVGSGYSNVVIGPNYLRGVLGTLFNIGTNTKENFYPGNHVFGTAYSAYGATVSNPINIANAAYLAARDAANSNWRRLIGLDASDQVTIAPDGQTILLNGSIKLSANSTAITQIKVYTPTLTPADVGANTTEEQSYTVTGLSVVNDTILGVVWPAAVTGLVLAGYRINSDNNFRLTWANITGTPITPPSGTYRIVALRS